MTRARLTPARIRNPGLDQGDEYVNDAYLLTRHIWLVPTGVWCLLSAECSSSDEAEQAA